MSLRSASRASRASRHFALLKHMPPLARARRVQAKKRAKKEKKRLKKQQKKLRKRQKRLKRQHMASAAALEPEEPTATDPVPPPSPKRQAHAQRFGAQPTLAVGDTVYAQYSANTDVR